MRRRFIGVAAALVVLLSGCTADAGASAPSPTPVSQEQAHQLALVRFNNFDAGTRSVHTEFSQDGHDVRLDGWYDYEAHTGYAVVAADGGAARPVLWTPTSIASGDALAPGATASASAMPSSLEGWSVAQLAADRSGLEALLAIIGALGDDRPENPLLLQQGGALWLRDDRIGSTPVTVYAGPTGGTAATPAATGSATRYWVDDDALLRRLEVRLGGGAWTTIDFDAADGVRVPTLLVEATQ